MAINLTRPQPNIVMPDGAWMGRTANGPKVAFDDTNNYLEITGCNVIIGGTVPLSMLHISGTSVSQNVDIRISNIATNGHTWRMGENTGTDGNFGFYDTTATAHRYVIDSSGNIGFGTTTPSNLVHAVTNPATTNTVIDVLRLDRTTSGTAADGIGCGIVLYAEDASANIEEAANIDAVFTTAAHATQVGEMRLGVMGTNVVAIDSKKNVVLAPAAIATDATDGFTYIPTCAGAPTGVPTAKTGTVALVFDTSNNKLYVYDGGWLNVTLAA